MKPSDPAFPKADTVENKDCFAGDYPRVTEGDPGMTLRAYLAGQALIGYLAMCSAPDTSAPEFDRAARAAVAYADALIAQLNKTGDQR